MVGKVTRSIEDRFHEKVTKTNSCWIWSAGHRNPKGYGGFWLNGRNHAAQRISWLLFRGEFDQKLRVLHKCDTPSCVNPLHLFLGTDSDNLRDAAQKGRMPKGERNGNSKLTADQVRLIRKMPSNNYGEIKKIAVRFGIDRTQVYNIIKRRQWKHV